MHVVWGLAMALCQWPMPMPTGACMILGLLNWLTSIDEGCMYDIRVVKVG